MHTLCPGLARCANIRAYHFRAPDEGAVTDDFAVPSFGLPAVGSNAVPLLALSLQDYWNFCCLGDFDNVVSAMTNGLQNSAPKDQDTGNTHNAEYRIEGEYSGQQSIHHARHFTGQWGARTWLGYCNTGS
jgi:hypothetical protein